MSNTYSELLARIKIKEDDLVELRALADEARLKELATVISDLRSKIAEFGVTGADLGFNAKGGKSTKKSNSVAKAAPKYRSETGETWGGGRGRKPGWVTKALSDGKNLDDFLVK